MSEIGDFGIIGMPPDPNRKLGARLATIESNQVRTLEVLERMAESLRKLAFAAEPSRGPMP